MLYYPKSQIKSNLFTNGNEYILSTTKEEYKGFYYETSNGNKFTGKNPNDGNNILLIPQPTPIQQLIQIPYPEDSPIVIQTTEIIPLQSIEYTPTILPTVRSIPQFNPTTPTTQDYQNEQFNRYFCKKNNELIYIEIDNPTYQLLQNKSSTIAWDLYTPTTISWKIGDQAYLQNQSSVLAIEQNLKWYGFSQYFKGNFSSFPTSTRK